MVTSRNALRQHISHLYPAARITRHPTDTNCLIGYNLQPIELDILLYGCEPYGSGGYLFRLNIPNTPKAPKPLPTRLRGFRAALQEQNLVCDVQESQLPATPLTIFNLYEIVPYETERWEKRVNDTAIWLLFRFSTEHYCLTPTEGKKLINPGLNPCGTRTRSDGVEYIYIAVNTQYRKSLRHEQSVRLTCAMKHFSNAYLLLSNILYNNFDLEEAKVLFEGYSKKWDEEVGSLTGEELGLIATKFSNGVETITM